MAIGQFLKRNVVSILFPTIAVSTIWLDWTRTRNWKKQNQQLQANN